MTHILQFENEDQSSSLSLATGNYFLERFSITSAEADEMGIFPEGVTEGIELMVHGATTVIMQAKWNEVEQWLLDARIRRRKNKGKRIYLIFQPTGDGDIWRSEILAGVLKPGDKALQAWGGAMAQGRLIITRRPFWETRFLYELPLYSKASPTYATGGRTIHNHNDSGEGNYLRIQASDVRGALPAPLKLQLVNNTGATQDYRKFHFSNNVYSDPVNFTHILEGENRKIAYGTALADAACSNGEKVSLTTSTTVYCKWDLSTTLLTKAAGNDFRILARFANYPSSPAIYVTPIIQDYYGLVDVYTGNELKLPAAGGNINQLVDLGSLPLPPGGYNTNWAQHVLALKFRTTGSVTIDIDFLQLTSLDSYRFLEQRGMAVLNNDSIIDDGPQGIVYLQESAKDHPIYSSRGKPLMVHPNKAQVITVLHEEALGQSPIANSFSARAFYRPRRLSL